MSSLLQENGDALLQETGDLILLDVPQPAAFPTLPPTLESILATHHTPVARLEFLDSDLTTVLYEVSATADNDDRRLIEGSVTFDRSMDSHCTAKVTLANTVALFSPRDSSSLVWPSRIVRLSRGVVVGSTPQYVDLMTGLIDGPEEGEQSARIAFSVASLLTLLSKPFPEPISFAPGISIAAVVRAVFELGAFGTSDARYVLDDDGQTLTASQTYDGGDQMLSSMVKLAFDAGLDLYDDGAGVLHLEPFINPDTVDPIWDYAPGLTSTLVNLKVTRRAQAVYNRQPVGGTGSDGYPIWGEAKVTDASDPLFWTASNDRPAPAYVITGITATQQMVNAVAQRLLIERAYYEESVAGSAVGNPLVRDRKVVRVQGAGVNDRYLVDQATIQLGMGAMQFASRKVRSLIS